MVPVSKILKILMSRPLINFMMALLGLSAAYYSTIGSIEVRLEKKAEQVLVNAIDNKLTGLEVLIREGVVGKDQFFEFKSEMDRRLDRIEFHLMEEKGE